MEINRVLRKMHPEVVAETERRVADLGGRIARDPATDMMLVNGEFTISIVLARCHLQDGGRRRWKVRFDTGLLPDITVAVRLDASNTAALDYYLLPRLDFGLPRISLAEQNAAELESFRFENLEYLYGMAKRERLRWGALKKRKILYVTHKSVT